MENLEIENKTVLTEETKKLYRKAKQRVSFKIHLGIYLLCVVLFWLLWGFLFKDSVNEGESSIFLRLTLAITLFWALFIVAHYLIVYQWNKSFIEREIKRLEKKQKKQQVRLDKLKQEENQL